MANDLNRWEGIGHIGKDPEIRYTPDGAPVANFSIACNESWMDKGSGEKQERVEWVRLVAFKKLAEIIEKYCKKGQQVYVSGRLKTRKWQDKDGTDRYTTEVVLNDLQMLGSKGGGSKAANQAEAYAQASGRAMPAAAPAVNELDDDIPF